jgi:Pyruvate/2-oxoacid:ferredoxin oxidoreductase delta subunit
MKKTKINRTWTLQKENCTGCGICFDVCKENAIHMTEETAYPSPNAGKCTGCHECEQECPFNAIKVTASNY